MSFEITENIAIDLQSYFMAKGKSKKKSAVSDHNVNHHKEKYDWGDNKHQQPIPVILRNFTNKIVIVKIAFR